jgi:hypothetical protein
VVSRDFPVALARGKHLFPFRTEQLSPSAPMVLGPQGPGRVGRRRFFMQQSSRPRAARRASGNSMPGRPRTACPRRALDSGSYKIRPSTTGSRHVCATARLAGRRPGEGPHRGRCGTVCLPASYRRKADLGRSWKRAAATALRRLPGGLKPPPVRMLRCGGLLVDLPVDVVVVLDDQERAGRGEHRPGAASKVGLKSRSEHVCDCKGGLGRNRRSVACATAAMRKIRIVKPFLGLASCNENCIGARIRPAGALARQGARTRSRKWRHDDC